MLATVKRRLLGILLLFSPVVFGKEKSNKIPAVLARLLFFEGATFARVCAWCYSGRVGTRGVFVEVRRPAARRTRGGRSGRV
jgi:hypothetical protein